MSRILIADDHDLVRDMLVAFLEKEGTLQLSATASFQEAVARITAEGPFDLVLLDWSMPGMAGLAGLKAMLELQGGRPVAIVSGTASRDVAQDALAAGAAGFLPKTMPAKSLVHAVNFMLAGEQYAPVAFMTGPDAAAAHPMERKLTERERQVLSGLCRGLSNKEIGRELALQEVTVKLHVRTLCRKIDAKNRTQAALIAKEAALF